MGCRLQTKMINLLSKRIMVISKYDQESNVLKFINQFTHDSQSFLIKIGVFCKLMQNLHVACNWK